MSKAGNFFAKLAADKEAMDKLDHVLGGKEIADLTDAQKEEIGKIIKSLGFDLTAEDVKSYLESEDRELSDDALEAVAGGKFDNSKLGDLLAAVGEMLQNMDPAIMDP